MTAAEFRLKNPDRSIANRDSALPGLPYLLDNSRLSDLLGEPVRVTRVRYKPHTSLLVAFRRARRGSFDYGWAMTRAAKANGKLLRREEASSSRGGDIRLLHPDPRLPDTLVAVGGVEDDWALQENLTWFREHGLARLGLRHAAPGSLLSSSTTVLRYKPERRLVLLLHNGGAPVVVTASAKPLGTKHRHFHDTLHLNGVPVLPQLGDSECAERGLSACAAWGGGDLAGLDDAHGAWRAGEALARVHDIPTPADSSVERRALHHDVAEQLAATRSMVASLVPALENSARKLEDVLRTLLTARGSFGARGSLAARGSGARGPGEPALVHGDFTPEQVLVKGSEVRIIDFDNAGTGDPEADLGSFAAAEEAGRPLPTSGSAGGPLTARLAEGYAEAGGRFRQTGVDAWAAFRLFTNCLEPFNDRAPEWADDMSWHLRRAQDLTAS